MLRVVTVQISLRSIADARTMDLYSDREDEAVQQPTTVKTRICMISDSHGKIPSPDQFKTRPFRYPLPSADILIHAGDLTQYGTYAEHKATVNMLRSADAELKIVIAGNHDITLDRPWWRKHGETVSARYGLGMQDLDRIRDLYCGKEAVENGIRYLEEGVSTFTLKKKKGGATFTVYSSPWQPVHSNWAFTYPLDVDRWNAAPSTSEGGRARFEPPNPVPSHPAIDIMVTHGPPHGVLDITIRPTSTEDDHVGCRHLLRAVARCRPRLHVFGHIHGKSINSVPHTSLCNGKLRIPPTFISYRADHNLQRGVEPGEQIGASLKRRHQCQPTPEKPHLEVMSTSMSAAPPESPWNSARIRFS